MPEAIAYYPGCSLHSTAKEYDESLRAVFTKLGVELKEPEGWICCGASSAHSVDELLAAALPAQNLQLIEDMGAKEVAIPCAACFLRFKTSVYDMKQSKHLEGKVAETIGKKYGDTVTIRHPVEILEKMFANGAKNQIKKDLGKIKLACYYGCMLTRPPKVTQFDDCEDPQTMDRLLKQLGAETLVWSYKTDCCGASLALSEPDVVVKLSRDILADARACGAEAIVTACQLCQANLDTRQGQIAKKFNENFNLPILYFSQLVGLALGLEPGKLGFDKHLVDPKPLLRKYGLLL
ncbi:MAG: CoB--CoM heterodisulfide reductase iron-sulfur subunit B family protein [Elusimicrobia bacterium]|nr:CoB--CoM heterodisulfide reductase iron-sulfur subunit B family protein [Elusimicrobiota bacterium]